MYLCKGVRKLHDVFAEVSRGVLTIVLNRMDLKSYIFLITITSLSFLASTANSATYTINVSLSTSAVNPTALQQDILSNLTTGQYLGTMTPNPYFANTYSIVLKGKNPAYQVPSASTTLITLDTLTEKLVKISSDSFVYGYLSGMSYERTHDMGLIGKYILNCSSAPYFNTDQAIWDSQTCDTALWTAHAVIFEQNFSTPTIVPGF